VRRARVPSVLREIDPSFVRGVLSRDLTGDGIPEIVLASQHGIVMGQTAAIVPDLGSAFTLAACEMLQRLDIGDINRDGVPEIITAVGTNGSPPDRLFSIHRWSRRHGRFETLFQEGGSSGNVELRDLDRDGIPEVLFGACSDTSGPEERTLSYWTDVYAWNGRRWAMANERFPAVFEQFLDQAKQLRKELKGWEDFETLVENERRARRILRTVSRGRQSSLD